MNYKVGVYIRLSKEDDGCKESESVFNQRNLINDYLKKMGLCAFREYVDDGVSGTTFDRPGFSRLICDIENGIINMVITKDLSRLGRNYIKSGYYIEEYFPLKKVRYVSILDNIDTSINQVSNEMAPFKALFNDMVSRDTSKKIKSILVSKKKEGKYLGAKAPYGYMKDKGDKHRLIIDKSSALVVKRIYMDYLNGKSINEIARALNMKGVLAPSGYKFGRDSKWSYMSIYNILKNEIYMGKMVQNVWTNVSYKNKKRVKRDKDEWIVCDGINPIVDKNIFLLVQDKLRLKCSTPVRRGSKELLEGLVFCKECNHLLGLNVRRKNKFLLCNSYKKNASSCTSHYINYGKLEGEVISRIRGYIPDNFSFSNDFKIKKLVKKKNLLYEDRLNGIISLDKYLKLCKRIDDEINGINRDIDFKINRDLLFSLIRKIVVDKDKNVFIYYKFRR